MYKKTIIILFFLIIYYGSFAQELISPQIIKVSYNIANNFVQIWWKPSPSIETTHYEVWYADDKITIGKVAFQKVPGSDIVNSSEPLWMEFRHDRALLNSNGYFITAYGPSDATSDLAPCDSTVFLNIEFDSCLASATLQWNDYNRWRGNIAGYKVFGSTNGSIYNLLQSLPDNTTECTINNLDAYKLYSFYVLALKNSPADSSYSNRVDVNTRMAANPSYIYANYGTVESGHPVVSFNVDPVSELTNFILLRADSPSGEFDSITTIQTLNKTIEYSDIDADVSQQPYYYRLNALNYCGKVIRSSDNLAGTIYIETNVSSNIINLSWNSYQNWPEGVEYYVLERNIGGTGYESITTTSDLSYTDRTFEQSANRAAESDVCYRVTAIKTLASASSVSSISNEVCVELNMNVRFQFDAFIPGSTDNSTFGPSMDFIPKSVTFSIFNRWGNQLFETSDPNNLRWDGIYLGNKVDQGVYRFELKYTNEKGKESVMHGNVTIIYP